jgi:hypothetical protein
MFIFRTTLRRANPFAPYTAPDGTRYPRIPLALLQEIPDPQPPEDYSEDTYFRTEQDDAPYVLFTRKSDEQINQAKRARILAQVSALEQGALMARQVREVVLGLPGADQQPWFARVKSVDDEVAALRAALPPAPPQENPSQNQKQAGKS